jgi:hypothetical protein
MAGTGHGQTFQFGSTTLGKVEDVKFTAKGQVLSKVVADAAYPITATVPGLAKWTVTFNLPATTPEDVLNAIDQGTTGTITWDKADGVKVTTPASGGIAVGFDISAPSGGWVTVTAEFVANGAITIAAETP